MIAVVVIPMLVVVVLTVLPALADRSAVLKVYGDKDNRYRWWTERYFYGYRVRYQMKTNAYTSPPCKVIGMPFFTKRGAEKFISRVDGYTAPKLFFADIEKYKDCGCAWCKSDTPSFYQWKAEAIQNYTPSKSKRVSRYDVISTLEKQFPGVLDQRVTCPVCVDEFAKVKVVGKDLSGGPATSYLDSMIVHLNDKHRWTREQIADWLEESDLDIIGKVAT